MPRLTALLVLFSLAPAGASANPNACDDYLSRHYRKDLRSFVVTYQNRKYMGDIYYPHQAAWIRVRNTGEVGFPASATGFNPITVNLNSSVVSTRIQVPIASGAEKVISVNLPPNTLKHCQKAPVIIDTLHNVGQWGCQVWNNDSSLLVTRDIDKLACVDIAEPIGPIGPPGDEESEE